MKMKTKKKPTWKVLYGESQMNMFREICKHPQGILLPQLRKKLNNMNRHTSYGLIRKLEEKKLIIREHRIKPPYLTLVKPTPEGIKLYKQYLTLSAGSPCDS